MILDKIIKQKRIEIEDRKLLKSISSLEKEIFFDRQCISLKNNLINSKSGIISEFKRKSPSRGWIHKDADLLKITSGYCRVGASGISILTDEPFFGGTPDDLMATRPHVTCPILRKDFIVNEYQIFESKAMGADVILLIAAALTPQKTKSLAKQAKSLGLEVLLEIHSKDELTYANKYVDILGVNNRNLKNFEVNIGISKELANLIPDEFVIISESGISNAETVKELKIVGYQGFLMGENFMKEKDPVNALDKFIKQII